MGGGGGGSQTYTKGYRYNMSILMGLGVGPIDEVTEVSVGDKKAWSGSLVDQNTININKPNLFGGESGEGGIAGTLWALFGSKTQNVPEGIKNSIGTSNAMSFSDWLQATGNRTGFLINSPHYNKLHAEYQAYLNSIMAEGKNAIPDFRGVATLFFEGMVCAINPYPKAWKFRRNRRKAGWDGDVWQPGLVEIDMVATVSIEDTDDDGNGKGTYSDVTGTIKAMNPIHVMYQLLTDRNFGRGYPRSWIDEIGFLAAAQQLKAEGFGFCYDWDAKSASIGDMVKTVLNTIGAALRVDRISGLISLKLFREDYDADMLPVFDRNSGLLSVDVDQSDANGQEINEQIVSYYDPISNSTRQVRAQNLGSMQTLGRKNSTTTSYDAVPTAALAGRLASRDLKVQGTSLRKYTLVFDRRAWRVSVGDVIRISLPERNINNVVLRVGSVQDSSMTDGTITVKGVLDVFGLPAQSYISSTSTSQWVPPPSVPSVITLYMASELSYRDIIRGIGSDEAAKRSRYETGYVGYAQKPGKTALAYSTIAALVAGSTSSDGAESSKSDFTAMGWLPAPLTPDQTTFSPQYIDDDTRIQAGQAVIIGDEVMRVEEWNPVSGNLTVYRGCVDSIPETHDSMSLVIFSDTGEASDEESYSTGSILQVKFLTYNMNGSTSTEAAPSARLATIGRQGRPWCPGNVQVNGVPFYTGSTQQGDIKITWAIRNRLITQDVLVPFESAGTVQEDSVVTILELYRGDTKIKDITFSAGETSWTWLKEDQVDDFASNPIPAGTTENITGFLYSRYPSSETGDLDSWKKVPLAFKMTPAIVGPRATEALLGRRDEAGAIRQIESGSVIQNLVISLDTFTAKTAMTGLSIDQGVTAKSISVPTLTVRASIGTLSISEDDKIPQSVTLATLSAKNAIASLTVDQADINDTNYRLDESGNARLLESGLTRHLESYVDDEPALTISVPTITSFGVVSAPIVYSGLQGKTLDMRTTTLSGVIVNKAWGT